MSCGLFLSALISCSCSTRGDAVSEAKAVVERTFGFFPDNVDFQLVDKADSCDRYILSSDGMNLTVKGSSAVAICKGFHDFIVENGYGIASWTGNRLDFPDKIPAFGDREVISPFSHHLFYNVCTFGYTSPFWDWKRWEQEIDWLALHGFDMPLAPVASEAISARVWRGLGLSQQEIDEYFCGPAHFPWMRMGNMSALDGGMSMEWHESQIRLQHRILGRMKSLGMTPVYQGFAGFVPKAMKDHYPEIDLTVTRWSGFENYMISPLDSLFSVIGTEYVKAWEKEFGKGKYYLVDSFNELDIPFGPKGSKERYETLHKYSETIYKSLYDANPDAVWVMQGWMFGYSRHLWDPESVEALLGGAPDGKMMVIDLAVDFNEYVWRSENSWDYLSGFYGKEWIWSTVPNFGGRSALKGPLDFYLNGHLEALASQNKGLLTGFGTSPEGIESNEVVYELISKAGWSGSRASLDDFLESYSAARYGAAPPEIMRFWSEMRQSVYDNFTNNARFLWQQRPAYHRGETMAINSHYFKGIESFLEAAGELSGNSLYVADAVQYASLYLAARADYVLKAANWSIVAGYTEKAEKLVALMCSILSDMDRLLESHPVLRMERWTGFAEASGTSAFEKACFVKEARRLVSTWGGLSLKDYSARVWSGLVRDFYVPRLEYFYGHAIRGEYADMVGFENAYHYGTGWGTAADVCPEGEVAISAVEPFADPVAAAVELVSRYSSIDYDARLSAIPDGNGGMIARWNEYAPDNEVGYWMPQDFAGKKVKNLYTSIMCGDYASMNGVLISSVRGNAVTVSRIEFRSGQKVLAEVNVGRKVGGASGSSIRVPYKGPGSTEGLEREVQMYVRIEGGPDSYGMISLY